MKPRAKKAKKAAPLTRGEKVCAFIEAYLRSHKTEKGADFYAISAYKWSGPHVGAVVADPGLLATLHPDKLASSPDRVPERFERGTAPFADLAEAPAT